jgi:DNA helicase-2/ATP-dependent DNA helicase PcrA
MKKAITREQLAIVGTSAPRVFVQACAGSGKTYTLCARVRRLLGRGIPVDRILVLSFSNTAVNILKARLPDGICVQTFHAFAFDIARKASAHVKRRPVLLSSERRLALVTRAVSMCPTACRSVRKKNRALLRSALELKRLAAFFVRCNGSDEIARRLVADAESGFGTYVNVLNELRAVRKVYDKLVERAGAIEYPAMLSRAIETVADMTLPYEHLLVDEAQDMSAEQQRLLVQLVQRIPNVMLFGDPKQAVFSFIGGAARDVQNVVHDVVTLPLTQSFRLTHENAALANAVLRSPSHAVVGSGHGATPSLVTCDSAIKQEDEVVRLVERLKAKGGAGNQIAILGRTRAQCTLVEKALLAAGHETKPLHRPRESGHVDRCLDLLALVETCVRTWESGKKPRKQWRLTRLRKITGVHASPAVEAECLRRLKRAGYIPSFDGRYMLAMRLYLKLLRTTRQDTQHVTFELGRWEPVSRAFESVGALRQHIQLLAEQTPVVTSTIHRAKGGEWDHVIVVGVTDGSIPFYREIKGGRVTEERRLFYVAVTRARRQLHLFHAPFNHAPSRKRFVEASRFIDTQVRKALRSGEPPSRHGHTRRLFANALSAG